MAGRDIGGSPRGFGDAPKTRKAAKLLVLSGNTAATDAERQVARRAALAIIERNGLDRAEVDAAACRLAGLPQGSFLKAPEVPRARRRFWRRGE